MKLLLFIDSLGAGGAQRQLVGLAVLLQEHGYKVKVCSYHNLDFYKQYLEENHVPNELISGACSSVNRILRVRQYFKKENPDWVIAYQETPSLVACAAKLLGCNYKLIVSERNTTQTVGIKERVRFFLYKWVDSIVPNSYAQENFLKKLNPWMKGKLNTITNFVDLEKFYPVRHLRNSVPEIVVAASLWASKNARGLISACKKLKEDNVKVHISWYGLNEEITEYQKETLQMVSELGVDSLIQFLPKTKTIEEKYREADYFCLPSFFEGTPNVICEAISSGVPVICSDVCDNGIYVKEGNNGFLFDPKNPSSIAEKIKQAISLKDDEYVLYCENSRKMAEEKLSKETFISKYINILNS